MHLSYGIDQETPRLPRLGLLVLQEDDTIEGDFRRLLPIDGMQLFHSRLPSPAEITSDTLPQMETALPTAAALLPDAAPIDVIGTGSYLPENWPETYATADIVAYDGRQTGRASGRERE